MEIKYYLKIIYSTQIISQSNSQFITKSNIEKDPKTDNDKENINQNEILD